MFVSTKFVVKYFSFGYGDGLEGVSGHVEDHEVPIGDMGAGMECGVRQWLGHC
jgi:hypothetical protein